MSVVGVRPNFVKLTALHRFLQENSDHMIIHTGQHYDFELSKVFFQCLELPAPHYNIGIGSGTHGYQLGEMIKRLEPVLIKEKPELVIVYGDANSTLAGALAAAKIHLRLAHVEAGYRSYERQMPEETNRVLTDHVSDFLFAPTENTVQNLKKENVQGEIHLTGDVMVDVLLWYMNTAQKKSKILERLDVRPKEYILITFHRESNTENRSRAAGIVKALLHLEEFTFVFPIHPRTKKALHKFGLYNKLNASKNVIITSPLNYLDFIKLEKNSLKILTDSGGVQKEAYVLGVPCITLRKTTGCIETVHEGWNQLVNSDTQEIVDTLRRFNPENDSTREALGKGDASLKINEIITNSLTEESA